MKDLQKVMSIVLILVLLLPTTSVFAEDFTRGLTFAQVKNYFYEGQDRAKRDYSGGGALAGGLVSGFGLGLIGWGLGYLIVSGMSVDVPSKYTADLNTNDRMRFEDGYSEIVKNKRKGKFNMGAGIGTLTIVLILLLSSGE